MPYKPNHIPAESLEAVEELVSNRNMLFFPLRTRRDYDRFSHLSPQQYIKKIKLYLIACENEN